ncbi:MAG: serine protease [Clostridia bacterium]|nr:serine protease [Clostridia bacterium]
MKKICIRVMSLCLFLLMCIGISLSAASTNVLSTSEVYQTDNSHLAVKKNLETSIIEYFDISSLNAMYSSSMVDDVMEIDNISNGDCSVTSIIGSDERVRITPTTGYPYSAILYVEATFPDGKTFAGTAFMISENVAATAGHVIYSHKHGGWATSVTVWPAKGGYGLWNNPYGTADSVSLHTSTPWIEDEDLNYDWGLIELDENIGEETGYFTFRYSNTSLTGTNITVTGYPGDSETGSDYYQYSMSGTITNYTDTQLDYTIDTEGGQSGSPVYTTTGKIVYGIHSHGIEDTNGVGIKNVGVRITSDIYDYFQYVINNS